MINSIEFQKGCDDIFSHLFLKNKESYKNEVRDFPFSWMLFTKTKFDYFPLMWARLKGMSTISKRKYGIYNKAIDGDNLFKSFPWLDYDKG